MERLGDGVREQLGRAGPPGSETLTAVVAAWPRAVGDPVARSAWPLRIGRDGTLHVATASSTWAFELDRLSPWLLERLREELGDDAPPALRFAPGPLASPAAPPDEGPRSVAAPGPQEEAAAAELASSIADPELRELVARAVAAALSAGSADRDL